MSRKYVLVFVTAVTCLAATALPPAADAQAASPPNRDVSCIYSSVGSPSGRAPGFRGTSVYSYEVAGPGVIHYSASKAAAQTFGASASISFDIGVFIAKSETTFGVNYSRTATTTEAWGYDTTIPSGRTGRMAVLHRNDRISYLETIHNEDCSTTKRTGYGYVPLASTSSATYCIIRDLAPYSFTSWRSSCVGE